LTYAGDLDSNHKVDIYDYNTLKTNFGTSNSAADINKDGTVNIYDYNILKGNFGLSF